MGSLNLCLEDRERRFVFMSGNKDEKKVPTLQKLIARVEKLEKNIESIRRWVMVVKGIPSKEDLH